MATIASAALWIDDTVHPDYRSLTYHSLRKVVRTMYAMPAARRRNCLLCAGWYSLGAPQPLETEEAYYDRMKKQYHQMFD